MLDAPEVRRYGRMWVTTPLAFATLVAFFTVYDLKTGYVSETIGEVESWFDDLVTPEPPTPNESAKFLIRSYTNLRNPGDEIVNEVVKHKGFVYSGNTYWIDIENPRSSKVIEDFVDPSLPNLDPKAAPTPETVPTPPPPTPEPAPEPVEKPKPVVKPVPVVEAPKVDTTAELNIDGIADRTEKIVPTVEAVTSLKEYLASKGVIVSAEEAQRLYTQGWYERDGERYTLWQSDYRTTPSSLEVSDGRTVPLHAFFETKRV